MIKPFQANTPQEGLNHLNLRIRNSRWPDEIAGSGLYWVTQTIHSSIRIYNKNSKHPLTFAMHDFLGVPVAFAKFPEQLPTPPRTYIEKGFNITRWPEWSIAGILPQWNNPAY